MAFNRRANRWFDREVGDDPIDRQTRRRDPNRRGFVIRKGVRQEVKEDDPEPLIQVAEEKTISSQESGFAPFDTLWHNFELEAIPFYNFWEPEEEESSEDRGNQELVDLPRFVKLLWNPSPDIKDPNDAKKKSLMMGGPGIRVHFKQLSPFGFGANVAEGVQSQGTNYLPAHLQPDNFEKNAENTANSFIAPGIVAAVSSVPVSAVSEPPKPSPSLIDEDAYLENHKKWWGIPFSEMNAALWRRKSSVFGAAQKLWGRRISENAEKLRDGLVSGQFGLRAFDTESSANTLVGTGPTSVSIFGSAARGSRQNRQSRVNELASEMFKPGDEKWDREHHARVNMIHSDFSGLLSQERIDTATQAHHLESTVAIAQHAQDLVAFSNAGLQHYKRDITIPSDRAPDTLKPLEYIGYVIEKWEMIDGAFQLVEKFYIPGRDNAEYYDADVKYGANYRYRICAIIRWCRPHGIGIFGSDPNVIDAPGVSTETMAPNDVSYFHTEWGHEWANASVIDLSPPNPPEELIVMPHSEPFNNPENKKDPRNGRPYVSVAFRLPHNPQRDINKMTLFRKLVDESGNDLTGWVQMFEQVENLDDKTRQGTFTTYKASYEHQQDDITGTKFNMTETVETGDIVEYGPANARFDDFNVKYWGKEGNYRYVYAAMCYTKHGEESVLSDQVSCRLNPDWKKSGEFSVELVSSAGVDKDFDTGIFSTMPERRIRSEFIFKPDLMKNKLGKAGVSGQERLAAKSLNGSNYSFRVESLDTGEHVDIPVTLEINNLPEQTRTIKANKQAIAAVGKRK